MARVLAVDIGTSSVRATLYGQNLQPVRLGSHVRYRWRTGSDGSVEAAPATIERGVAQAVGVTLQRAEPTIARVFHPDARSHAVYRAAAARQQALLRAVLT